MPLAGVSFARSQILGYCALCLIWGSTWLAISIVVKEIPPLQAAALRFLIAAALLLGSLLFRRAKWPQGKNEWNAIVLLGLTVMALPYGLLFWAEQYVTSSMTALLFSAMPLVVALITPLMLHRSVPRTAVFSMLMALGGIAILFNGLDANSRSLLGGLAVLAAVCISSWAVVYAKKTLQNMDPVISTGLQCLFGCIALFWGSWALEAHRTAHWSRKSILALIFLAVFGSATAFALYYWLLKHMQPYQLSSVSLVVPIIALAEGALFAHEAIPFLMIVSMVIVLGAVGLVLQAEISGSGTLLFSGESE
ncbi:MAG TPA: EamA family transporter [Candidatus Angelobacter sp.]|nr:EamA family transporter [Candidatus Angelobacter sp.]